MKTKVKFLDLEPAKHKFDLAKCMIWARSKLNKRLASQVIDMAKLAWGAGKLSAEEYYSYQLYDDAKYSAEEKRKFLGKNGMTKIYGRVISPYFIGLSHDKLVAEAVVRGVGLPLPQTYAVYHELRSHGSVPVLRSPQDLMDYLRSQLTYPCFAKPINGWQSRGVAHLERYEEKTDSLALGDGRIVQVEDFAQEIGKLSSGFIFQELLLPHPILAQVCGERVSTIRCIVLVSEKRVEIFRAAWKIPANGNVADNFWRPGNLLADVDVADGRVRRIIRGTGPDQEHVERHPDTDKELIGTTLPEWAGVKRLSEDVASIFPHLHIVASDIAITDRGPVVVEVNAGGDMD
ncbi:MAG: sugar-transfer associated ATP-grasp domain-containing protein, partial [Planctomycetota bacterium]